MPALVRTGSGSDWVPKARRGRRAAAGFGKGVRPGGWLRVAAGGYAQTFGRSRRIFLVMEVVAK